MLENQKIKLRAPEPEDLEAFYRWENDTTFWSSGSTLAPFSRYDLKQYLLSSKDFYETKQLRLMIEALPEKQTVGIIDLYDFEPHHRRAGVGILIDKDNQQKGLATEALSLLCNYAFSFLKIHQLYAYIPASNEPSKRLFMRCGFKERGLLPEWQLVPAGYEDVWLVTQLHN